MLVHVLNLDPRITVNCMVVFQAAEAYKKSTLGMKSMEDELEKLEDALDAEEEVTPTNTCPNISGLAHSTLESIFLSTCVFLVPCQIKMFKDIISNGTCNEIVVGAVL